MSKRKLTKEELKSPDAFVSSMDRVALFFKNAGKPILVVVGLGLLGGTAYVGWEYYQNQLEHKTQSELFEIEHKIQDKVDELGKSADKVQKDQRTYEAHFTGLMADYEKKIRSHLGTSAAAVATLEFVKLCKEYKVPERSLELLQAVGPTLKPKGLLFALVHTELGNILSETDKCKDAVVAYGKVLGEKSHEFMHGAILLKVGLCQEALGEVDQARATFEQVRERFSDGSFGRTAESYLNLLSLKKDKRG